MNRLLAHLLLASIPVSALAAAAPRPVPFELSRLNRTYEDMVDELDPWQQGAMTVKIRSPNQRLTLFSHRVWLRPSTRGYVLVDLDLEFEAAGDVIADLEMGRISQQLEDRIVAPRQERSLRGEVEIVRVEGGYRITTLRLPSHFKVRIESRLTDSLIEVCRQISILPMMPVDCPSFERSLSEIDVQLPAAGTSYLLSESELTAKEQSLIEAFLAARPRPKKVAGARHGSEGVN